MSAIARAVAQRVKVRLSYRGDLVASVVSGLLLTTVGPIFIVALFRHVDTLAGYTGAQVLFCWGFAEAAVGLFYVLFGGLYGLNQRYILGGELDRVLLRPLDPLVQILVDNLAIEDAPTLLAGVALMGVAVAWGLPPVPGWRWLLLPGFVLCATAVLGGILTAIASLAFHLHHRGTAISIALQLTTFIRYPIDVFAAPLRWLITLVVPIAFAGFYPASLFLGSSDWLGYAAVQPLVAIVCLAGGYLAWRIGLRRYTSAGS